MKIRLFLAALCLFLAPLCFAPAPSQFSVYACSGYNIAAGRCCECEEEGCVCGDTLRTDPNDTQTTASNAPTDSSSGILFAIAAAMLIWRLRA